MERNETKTKKETGFVRKPGAISGTEQITNSAIDSILSFRLTELCEQTELIAVRAVFIHTPKDGNSHALQINVSDKGGKTIVHVRYGMFDGSLRFEYLMSGDNRIHYLLPGIAHTFRDDSFDKMIQDIGEIFTGYVSE